MNSMCTTSVPSTHHLLSQGLIPSHHVAFLVHSMFLSTVVSLTQPLCNHPPFSLHADMIRRFNLSDELSRVARRRRLQATGSSRGSQSKPGESARGSSVSGRGMSTVQAWAWGVFGHFTTMAIFNSYAIGFIVSSACCLGIHYECNVQMCFDVCMYVDCIHSSYQYARVLNARLLAFLCVFVDILRVCFAYSPFLVSSACFRCVVMHRFLLCPFCLCHNASFRSVSSVCVS